VLRVFPATSLVLMINDRQRRGAMLEKYDCRGAERTLMGGDFGAGDERRESLAGDTVRAAEAIRFFPRDCGGAVSE